MKYEVNIFLDGVRDQSHSADGLWDDDDKAFLAMKAAIGQPAVSSVFMIKRSDNHKGAQAHQDRKTQPAKVKRK
jgi:hypothetical protein